MDDHSRPLSLLRSFSDDTSKREQAYHQLRRLLVLQQIPEGSRLREAEWTSRFGVNRSALREALARLEAEGLVVMGPKTGYFVPRLGPADIREILTVRVMLEAGAIELICQTGLNTTRHLKPMRQACDQLERLVQDEYLLGAVEADWRFHESLILASENRRLSIAYRHSPMLIIHPEVLAGKQWEQTMQRTVAEHRNILESILAGDIQGAKNTLRRHITEHSFSHKNQAQAV
jgi:DNA-binding GntR family transcriptional regulator